MTKNTNPEWDSGNSAYDSILLVGFGGPTPGCCRQYDSCPGEAHCFVEGIVGDAPSNAARVKEVANHYVKLGGFSPFNELTFKQADALGNALRKRGVDSPIYVGMRNWTPYLHETIARMVEQEHRNVLAIIMSAYRSKASWERYQNDVITAVETVSDTKPSICYLEDLWYLHPGFINAIAERIRSVCSGLSESDFTKAALIFTAHAIPQVAAKTSPYPEQFRQTASAVAAVLGTNFDIAYQSAPDNPTVPWTGPDINDLIREKRDAGVQDVIVSPIGFLCDHVEVLYDLDLEARATAEACGMNFIRAGTVGEHPEFINMLANLACKEFQTVR